VRCVACWRGVFLVTRAMTLTCRYGGWGLPCRAVSCVSSRACVWCDGVGERGARCALGLRGCEAAWLHYTRDVECVSWACITGAVSSAGSRVLRRSISVAECSCRVCVAAASRGGCCVTAQRCVGLCFFVVDCSCLCVPLRCVHACVTTRCSGRAVLRWARCRWQWRSLAMRATHQCDTW
jgi:hypothetical protein